MSLVSGGKRSAFFQDCKKNGILDFDASGGGIANFFFQGEGTDTVKINGNVKNDS